MMMLAPTQRPLLIVLLLLGPVLLAHALQPDGNGGGGGGGGKPPLAPSSSGSKSNKPGARLLGGEGGGDDRDAMLDLGRLFREQEEKEIARLKAQEQAALDAHTAVDARGVRRPLDRALAFFPPGTTPSTPAPIPAAAASAAPPKAPPAGSSASSASKGDGEGTMDPALLRRALAARRKQVARLTEFRSRRTREIEARRLKTKVPPVLLLRLRFPDGATLQARFHPDETVEDVIALVLGAFRQADYPTLPFALVSPGAAGVKRKTLGGDGTRNWTLAQVGLAPPAATLLVQWKGGKGGEDAVFPKTTAAWVREDLQQAAPSGGAGGGGGGDEL